VETQNNGLATPFKCIMCRNFPHSQIPPKCLFTLLTSLDKPSPDSLEVLDLVRAEKPLKPTVRIQTYLSDTAFHLNKVSKVLWKHFPILDIKCENVSSLKLRKDMWCCLAKFVTRCVVLPTKVSFFISGLLLRIFYRPSRCESNRHCCSPLRHCRELCARI